jgi:ATPase subunit of ABC transporter with duplicated ATPase domains
VLGSLVVTDLSFSFGPTETLSSVSFVLGSDARVGVLGPNGSGKTTLLRLLAGDLLATGGSIVASPRGATIGYVTQQRERAGGETVAAALERSTGVAAASAELDAATAALAASVAGADERYANALDRWLELGGGDIDARMPAVLAEVGLSPAARSQTTANLSGGELARVSLAGILLGRYDLVLLDEPTNDLDFAGLELLEHFVTSRNGGVVIVSHDRAFLERTVTSVLELDAHSHHATLFGGGFTAYQEERATARAHAEEDYAVYASQRAELEDRGRRQRQWASVGRTKALKRQGDHDKAQRDFQLNRTEKLAAKVRISEKALDRLEAVEKPFEGWELHLEIAAAPRSGDVVARLEQAVVERGEFSLGPVDLEIRFADRVVVTGPNGSGKTTLIDLLLGRVAPVSGAATLGRSVVVGELDQERSRFQTDETLLGVVDRALDACLPVGELRSLLAKFGLGAEHVTRSASTLSPGERTRALLALFMARGVNLLVLDEPTNHLDLPAIEQLEAALAQFAGTLLLVSHDRRLLEVVDTDVKIELARHAGRTQVVRA